jgi:hypothetical protein
MTKQSLSSSYFSETEVCIDPNHIQYLFYIPNPPWKEGFRAKSPAQLEKKSVSLTGEKLHVDIQHGPLGTPGT